jgi:hypothetical protein
MCGGECRQHLEAHCDGVFIIQRALLLEGVLDSDHPGVLQTGQHPCLYLSRQSRFGGRLGHDFDGSLNPKPGVECPPDLARTPGPQ